jgi:hypothetical protein
VKGFSVEIKAELALVLSKNKQKQMEKENEVIVATVVETELALPTDAAPAPEAEPTADTTSAPTRDEVMQMIDVKFQSLNDEIMAIRDELEKLMPSEEAEPEVEMSKIEELSAKVVAIEETLANTAAVTSIKKDPRSFVGGFKAQGEKKMVDKFESDLERVRQFAKGKK